MRREDDRFTGLEDVRRGRRPRRRWTGTVGQRASAARRVPQAVFKISSHNRSGGAVHGRFQYMTREGEVEAEGLNGERLDQAQLARQLFRAAFADNHDYVFAAHSDTKNFHVHVVVQAAGHDGKQLRIGREDIQDLRLLMAEKAAEQGIELDASPRWARGLEKERRPGVKIEGMRRRFQSPEHALEGAWFLGATRRTQLEALAAVRGGADAARPVSPLEYARAGERLVTLAQGQEEESAEKVPTMKAAVELTRLGLTLSASARGNATVTRA